MQSKLFESNNLLNCLDDERSQDRTWELSESCRSSTNRNWMGGLCGMGDAGVWRSVGGAQPAIMQRPHSKWFE